MDERDQFLLRLAEEDLLSLKLRQANSMLASGRIFQAHDLLAEIVDKYSDNIRFNRWVTLARKAPSELTLPVGDP